MVSKFTMQEMQSQGQARGSQVNKASELTVAALEAKARKLLGLPVATGAFPYNP